MKLILIYALTSTVLLTGSPHKSETAPDLAERIIREHHLLTPKQIQCMTLVEREDTTAKVAK